MEQCIKTCKSWKKINHLCLALTAAVPINKTWRWAPNIGRVWHNNFCSRSFNLYFFTFSRYSVITVCLCALLRAKFMTRLDMFHGIVKYSWQIFVLTASRSIVSDSRYTEILVPWAQFRFLNQIHAGLVLKLLILFHIIGKL